VRLFKFICFLIIHIPVLAQDPTPPIGAWREHLPYNSAIDVTAGGGKVYAATPYSLFSVSVPGNNIERYSRVTGLSGTGISSIKYDEANDKLFIAYGNSNIDIVYRNDIYNIPDIKRDNIQGDKTIYNIYPLGKNYYLSTGLGVIVINGERYEIKDSWFIGRGGNQVKVNGFTSDATFFYAATEEGLKRISVNSPSPENFSSWQVLSGIPAKNVLNVQNRIIVQQNDSLFQLIGNNFSLFYTDGWPLVSINSSEGKLLISERMANGNSRVAVLNNDGTVSRILTQPAVISFPRRAILYNNDPWIADQFGSLSHFAANSFEQYVLNSPEETASGEMVVNNSVFYATAGAVNDSWNYQYNGNGIYMFKEGNWANINRYKYPVLDSLLDFIAIAIDPRDESIWAGSFGGGLLHVKPGFQFEIYKQQHLGPTIGDLSSYRVAGLAFDREHHLWIANFGSSQALRVRKSDGSWQSFTTPFTLSENALAQIIINNNNYKWIVSPLGNGLIVFDHGSTIDNQSDDRWRRLGTGVGSGNLPSPIVHSLAKDKNDYIWVGTSDGIGVFQCSSELFTVSGCDAIWPVVPHGNFAGYLFKGQDVRSIAVDGADRKWIATKNGVFLVSPDGEKIIYQFTEENSPLLSSDVRKITIDGKTGEVYFATLNGICSFRSTATEGHENNDEVLVFPNPVPPGYSGTIAIRGLATNSIVKITELNGRLVYQTRSLGGQAIWDGKDYRGRKISSGVYLVLVNNDDRTAKVSGKIVFLSQ